MKITQEKKRKAVKEFGEDTFIKLQGDTLALFEETVRPFYGISDQFPRDNLFTRSSQANKIYFSNPFIMNMIFEPIKLRVINSGIRIFTNEKKKKC